MQHDEHHVDQAGLTRRAEAAQPPAAAPAGAPPSITAPANSNPTILRKGIDSLYLSYKGQLSEKYDQKLRALKELAQSDHEPHSAGAQLQLGEHLFEVKPYGKRRFPIVLADNWFQIGLSTANSTSFPLASVQISSEIINAIGIEECTRHLTDILRQLATPDSEPQVSRLDLFMDFTCDLDFEAIPRQRWIKRARKRAAYEQDDVSTGWMFGQGGDIAARLYDKTVQIKQSHQDYLKLLWAEAGWTEGQTVWRLEFQLRREALQQYKIETVADAQQLSNPLWIALMTDWLRLAVPNPDDDTRSRWRTHPVWHALTAGFGMDAPSLSRVTKCRIPADQTLFKNGLWAITSFMAREGITDFGEGLVAYLQGMDRFYKRDQGSTALERYILQKVMAKGRRYNTINNRDDSEDEPE